jgi:hypothetical protein
MPVSRQPAPAVPETARTTKRKATTRKSKPMVMLRNVPAGYHWG